MFSFLVLDVLFVPRKLETSKLVPSTMALSQKNEEFASSRVSKDLHRQSTTKVPVRNCSIPDDWLYPLCGYKVQEIDLNEVQCSWYSVKKTVILPRFSITCGL